MQDNSISEEFQQELIEIVQKSVNSGAAMVLGRNSIMGVDHDKLPEDTYAIHLRGVNVYNEPLDFVLLTDVKGLKNIMDMTIVGLVHAEATELNKKEL